MNIAEYTLINQIGEVRKLVKTLREWKNGPAVIVTCRRDGTCPAQPDRLAQQLRSKATVYVIRGDTAQQELNRLLKDDTAYGGAVTVWASGRNRRWICKNEHDASTLPSDISKWLGVPDNTRTRIGELKTENDRLRKQLGKTRNEPAAPAGMPDFSGLFLDPRDQLDFEIQYQWAVSIPAESKTKYPLAQAWAYEDTFLDNIKRWQASFTRPKLLTAMVDILDGAASTKPSRRRHLLRGTEAVDATPVSSRWGTPIWRVNLTQDNGFRIHYTTDDQGIIHFEDLGPHDERL